MILYVVMYHKYAAAYIDDIIYTPSVGPHRPRLSLSRKALNRKMIGDGIKNFVVKTRSVGDNDTTVGLFKVVKHSNKFSPDSLICRVRVTTSLDYTLKYHLEKYQTSLLFDCLRIVTENATLTTHSNGAMGYAHNDTI